MQFPRFLILVCTYVFLIMYFCVFECLVVFDHDDIICMRNKATCILDIKRVFAYVIVGVKDFLILVDFVKFLINTSKIH